MRYKVTAKFQEEQRKGFIVTHVMEKEFELAPEMSDAIMSFLASYDSRYCHHMDFHVKEETHGS